MPKKKTQNIKNSAKAQKVTPIFDANKSVVQVLNNANAYDYTAPYFPPRQSGWSGSGVVVEGQGIITNAHVATDAERLYVRLANSDKLYLARVDKAGIGQDCDLAMLRVDDPTFWAKTQPVELSEDFSPDGSEIHVVGFPFGGKTVNHTKGIVGRLDHQDYVHSGKELAIQQVDAAVNPGNSGGPAIVDNKIAGIAFQGYSHYQNISYIIPAPIVRHYIEEVNRGTYKGFPELDIATQPLRNETLRRAVSMRNTDSGLLVNDPGSAKGHLQIGDVILSIEGYNITDLGSVSVDGQRLIDMQHIANMKFVGDTIKMSVLRDNEIKDISFQLKRSLLDASLAPMEYSKPPTYYANTGLVFQPLTFNYFLDVFGLYKQKEGLNSEEAFSAKQKFESVQDMIAYAKKKEKEKTASTLPKMQIVFISNVFPIKETEGFGMFREIPVMAINGRPIMNMADVIRAMENNKEPQHFIILANNALIAIPNLNKKQNDEINAHFGLHVERSADLKQLPDEDESEDFLLKLLELSGFGPEEALWPDEGSDVDPDYTPEDPEEEESAESTPEDVDMEEECAEEEDGHMWLRSQPPALLHQQMIADKQTRQQSLLQKQMELEQQQATKEQLSHLRMQM